MALTFCGVDESHSLGNSSPADLQRSVLGLRNKNAISGGEQIDLSLDVLNYSRMIAVVVAGVGVAEDVYGCLWLSMAAICGADQRLQWCKDYRIK